MTVTILVGDCMARLAELPDDSLDSCACDPPYHLASIFKRFGASNAAPAKAGKTGAFVRASRGFMGQKWDGGDVAFRVETWAEIRRVLKPGAHLVAFSGTRTYHRMACAIEDAGFNIRDQIGWTFGSGFPKSHDTERSIAAITCPKGGRHYAKALPAEVDRKDGDHICPVTAQSERWKGHGTALKPGWEPICLAQKPLIGSVARNVLKYGVGALNIDRCRIEGNLDGHYGGSNATVDENRMFMASTERAEYQTTPHELGRYPANLVHDGSDEVKTLFPTSKLVGRVSNRAAPKVAGIFGDFRGEEERLSGYEDFGSAARFFYTAKADGSERHGGTHDLDRAKGKGNAHPTVKPIDLMQWLVRLITPPGGTVLDPFLGSGSTAIAAEREQMNCIGCELSPDYVAIAERRIQHQIGMLVTLTISPAPLPADADQSQGSTGD